MAKVEAITQAGFEGPVGYMFACPGCFYNHFFSTVDTGDNWRSGGGPMPVWTFVNGDLKRPTFRASMLMRLERKGGEVVVCHSFVTEGHIEFLGDSTHALAGKTVELPEV